MSAGGTVPTTTDAVLLEIAAEHLPSSEDCTQLDVVGVVYWWVESCGDPVRIWIRPMGETVEVRDGVAASLAEGHLSDFAGVFRTWTDFDASSGWEMPNPDPDGVLTGADPWDASTTDTNNAFEKGDTLVFEAIRPAGGQLTVGLVAANGTLQWSVRSDDGASVLAVEGAPDNPATASLVPDGARSVVRLAWLDEDFVHVATASSRTLTTDTLENNSTAGQDLARGGVGFHSEGPPSSVEWVYVLGPAGRPIVRLDPIEGDADTDVDTDTDVDADVDADADADGTVSPFADQGCRCDGAGGAWTVGGPSLALAAAWVRRRRR